MSVKIIVDSTADLLPEIAAQVKIVPLTIRFGDREFIDGVTIDSKKFYVYKIRTVLHSGIHDPPFHSEDPAGGNGEI